MTSRAVLLAWAIAATLIGCATATILAGPARRPVFHGAQVAVIGTSLLRQAVPTPDTVAGGLLGNGWRHWRMGISAASENDVIALTSRALDEHARLVLVEANPLLFDFARSAQHGRCDRNGANIRAEVKALQLRVTDAFVHLVDRPGELDEIALSGELDHAVDPRPVRARGIYPLALRGSCRPGALRGLADRAHAGRQSLVLVLPPRSAASEALLGRTQKHALQASAHALAANLDARLFAPQSPWPDAEFVDGEHLNRHGRARFTTDLRSWWREQR